MTENSDIIIKAFPRFLANDVVSLLEKVKFKGNFENYQSFTVITQSKVLEIPYRFYFEKPKEKSLTSIESLILNSLFTRHHNGIVRQEYLEKIILSQENWVVPFVVQLLGEYVIQILEVIERNLNDPLLENITCFIAENPKYFETTKRRVISYWDCYYRSQFPIKEEYVGFKILREIDQCAKSI